MCIRDRYECKANKKAKKYHNVVEQSRRLYSNIFYKLRDSIAVSYTHLDVYKRQMDYCECRRCYGFSISIFTKQILCNT